KKWPYKASDGYKATPEILAKAGFYFKPYPESPDNVICFLCHKSMENWDPTDDPLEEHVNHSPDCAWVICRCIKRTFPDDESSFSWDNKEQLPTSKRMEEARLKTFGNWWPHDKKKGWVGTSKKMAKAGFYHAPTFESIDFVTCMYCEVGLEGWLPKDDPIKEHHKRLPSCPFFAKPASKLKKEKVAAPPSINDSSRRNIDNAIKIVKEEELDEPTDQINEVVEQVDDIITIEKEIGERLDNAIIIEEDKEASLDILQNDPKFEDEIVKGNSKEPSNDIEIIDLTSDDVKDDESREILPIKCEVINLEESEFDRKNEEENISVTEKFNNEFLSIDDDNLNVEKVTSNELIIESSEVKRSVNLIKKKSLEYLIRGSTNVGGEEKSIRESKLTEPPVKRSIGSFNELNVNSISSYVQEDNRENDLSNSDDNVTSLEIQRLSAELKIHELKILESISDNADDFDIIQTKMSDIDLNKESNEKIISPHTSNMCSNLTASEGLIESRIIQPMSHIPLAKHTPESTEPTRTICNKIKPSTFITPKEQNGRAAFTVEDYLRSLTETQHMRLVEKTNQKIETLIELKKKAKEAILSIPII
ncbi:10595_t:CDS:2, partial [Funneliformis caledonium]